MSKQQAGKEKNDPRLFTAISEMRPDVEAIAKNEELFTEINFIARTEAIDHIGFHIIDRIDGLLHTADTPAELTTLKRYAAQVKDQLEKVDDSLFRQLQANIRGGVYNGAAFRQLAGQYTGYGLNADEQSAEAGYDMLDLLTNRLLPLQDVPAETKSREPEMVYYQKTPARIIFELAAKARFTGDDVFYDLGSGLGQVCILVNLLSGVRAKGIEFEPAYCNYANKCAAELNLPRVKFINADARKVNYAGGTVFYMYTPFEGSMMQEVLETLQKESEKGTIRLFTYGPCTSVVARQCWLNRISRYENDIYQLALFSSSLKA